MASILTRDRQLAARNIPKVWTDIEEDEAQNVVTKPLYNQGIHCYRNALIWGLFHVPVTHYLLKFHNCANNNCPENSSPANDKMEKDQTQMKSKKQKKSKSRKKPRNEESNTFQVGDCLVCAFQKLLFAYIEHRPDLEASPFRETLSELQTTLRLISTWNSNLWGNLQEDTQELFSFCTQKFGERIHFHLFHAIFTMTAVRTTTCIDCVHQISVTEEDQDLRVHLPAGEEGPFTLAQLLRKRLKPERFLRDCNDPDSYGCDGVTQGLEADATLKILYAPEFLYIHIGRFIFDKTTQMSTKNPAKVKYNKKIKLNQYAKDRKSADYNYELCAATWHRGDLDSGHYTNVVLNQKGKWEYCDDSNPPRTVTQKWALNPPDGWDVYVLYYRKVDPSAPGKKRNAPAVPRKRRQQNADKNEVEARPKKKRKGKPTKA